MEIVDNFMYSYDHINDVAIFSFSDGTQKFVREDSLIEKMLDEIRISHELKKYKKACKKVLSEIYERREKALEDARKKSNKDERLKYLLIEDAYSQALKIVNNCLSEAGVSDDE